ncbi:MAG: MopE-related protein [Candidatus Woesearchaeota archaeon]|nr:MopE-related protein [Candidatus Woesearchaeota archaeon]
MGLFRSVMFAMGLTAAGIMGCEDSKNIPSSFQRDAAVHGSTDTGNNKKDAGYPAHDVGYQHDAYEQSVDAMIAYDATKQSDVYDGAQRVDAHDAEQMHNVDATYQAMDSSRLPDVQPPCTEGMTSRFYNGPAGTAGVGNCREGVLTCMNLEGRLQYALTQPEITPRPEICNGQDDNCSRQIDEGVLRTFYRDFDHDGFGDLAQPFQACEMPDGYTLQSGDCNDNNRNINPAMPEQCNVIDDDCDGAIDPLCECIIATLRECGDSNIGECRTGVQICDLAGQWSDCIGYRGPAPESCNGNDDDCNGIVDDNYNVGARCTEGLGACARTGVTLCAPEGIGTMCNAEAGLPGQERCDGTDADCNGVANNGYDVGAACNNGLLGACTANGVKECAPSGLETRCNAPIIPSHMEVCGDGIDQDCDGESDNAGWCGLLIAYICTPNGTKDVCVIDVDGQHKQNLTNSPNISEWNNEYPEYTVPVSWSPDAQWIAFISDSGRGPPENEIHRIIVQSRDREQIPIPQEPQVYDVEYSPDGTHIAYVSQNINTLKVINLETRETRQIDTFVHGHVKWLPDSSYLVYQGNNGLSVTKRDGSETRIVSGNGNNAQIEVSPDGTKVLSAAIDGNWNVYSVNLQTGERRQEVGTGVNEIVPRWLPDSTRYVFMRLMDVNYDIFLKDGEREINLTNTFGSEDREPTISPDGRSMVFVSDRNGTKDLYRHDLETGQEIRLTNDPGDEEAPVFAPVVR